MGYLDDLLDSLEDDERDDMRDKVTEAQVRNGDAMLPFGSHICYNATVNRIWKSSYVAKGVSYPLGISVGYNLFDATVDVLYRGFLLNDPIMIPTTVASNCVAFYVRGVFERVCDMARARMPRRRRLKRMNFKIPTRCIIKDVYDRFDTYMQSYAELFGDMAAQMFRAQLVTTPFYADYDGKLKVYKFETNEYYDCDCDGANFIPYFTFKNK